MTKLLLLLVLSLAAPVDAATLYAKAAGGNWSAASTWSSTGFAGMDDSGPPTRTEDVVFETGSGVVVLDIAAAEAKTVTLESGASFSAADGGVDLSLSLYLATTGTAWSAHADSTIDLGVSTLSAVVITAGETVTFAGGSHTYGNLNLPQTQASTFAITGSNRFARIILLGFFASGDPTIQLAAGSTTTIDNLTVSIVGPAHVFNLTSSSAGNPATITKANGVINVDALVVTDSAATGGATWCASHASANGGGNTGWQYTACPYEPLQSLTGVGR